MELYRAKKINSDEWVEGSLRDGVEILTSNKVYFVQPETASRFTNYRRVFEGDIIKYHSLWGIVLYEEDDDFFYIQTLGTDKTTIPLTKCEINFTVISNLWDSPWILRTISENMSNNS